MHNFKKLLTLEEAHDLYFKFNHPKIYDRYSLFSKYEFFVEDYKDSTKILFIDFIKILKEHNIGVV